MKKNFTLVAFVAVTLFSSIVFAADMDILAGSLVSSNASTSKWVKSAVGADAGSTMPFILKLKDIPAATEEIKKCGGEIISTANNIATARLSIACLKDISDSSAIDFVELSPPLGNKMNTARAAANVVAVQDGSGLGTAYDGKNVVVGVVDDALDYTHEDFGGASSTRIQYIERTSDEETVTCTKRSIMASDCAIPDGGLGYTHGTHVTGIAAGQDATYTGVAPASDIMFVFLNVTDAYADGASSTSFGANVLESATTIFSKADILDKAAVINLSLGTSLGAHDGTSLLEQGLTELTSAKPGRIIVTAAGNEQVIPAAWSASDEPHIGGIHASINSADGTSVASRFAIWSGAGSASGFLNGTAVDIWFDQNQKDFCSLSLFGYTGGRAAKNYTFATIASTGDAALYTGPIPMNVDGTYSANSSDSKVKVTITVDAEDARNQKPHALVVFESLGSSQNLEAYWYDVVSRASGGACTGNMWLYYDYTGYHDFLKAVTGLYPVASGAHGDGYTLLDGDSYYTMTVPSTATGVISVGSWLAQKPENSGQSLWLSLNGTTYDQSDIDAPGGSGSTTDDLSSFSSLGPTADGRPKPDIVAPGEPIVSAKASAASLSSTILVTDDFFKNEGTSMASPFVTGTVALLLQRNNTLTLDQVKAALAVGASTSGMIAKTPDAANSYGAGKINAVSILGSVSEDTSYYHGTGDLEPVDSGCTLVKFGEMRGVALWLSAILVLIPIRFFLLAHRRRRASDPSSQSRG